MGTSVHRSCWGLGQRSPCRRRCGSSCCIPYRSSSVPARELGVSPVLPARGCPGAPSGGGGARRERCRVPRGERPPPPRPTPRSSGGGSGARNAPWLGGVSRSSAILLRRALLGQVLLGSSLICEAELCDTRGGAPKL